MSARRQASTTSLSKYARAHSPDFADNSLDFCNAFWGPNDVGVEVLFARMRGALRTTEELRNWWKERATIEEQYAKKLAALAKWNVGRDEVGELRVSFDTLRTETEKQASYHQILAQQVRNDMETQTTAFLNKQLQHKKGQQAAIDREFKLKQQQEAHVNRAREKYEADCMRINSYTAQSTLMQGKELENMQAKLKRAQATVGANEQDFQKFTRALQETTAKWEHSWKAFCDSCQDQEEERMDFMKDNLWSYANAVSTVCVNDDEACEKMRLVLEQLEPIRDMASFVRTYGTGNAIPDPPYFINYADPNSVEQRPTSRPAQFQRVTERVLPMFAGPPPPAEESQLDELENTAGVGAGGGRPDPHVSRSRSVSRSSTRPESQLQAQNGPGTVNGRNGSADPRAPTEKTMLKVGQRAYDVDLDDDPRAPSGTSPSSGGSGAPARVGDEEDPLAQQMAELQRGATTRRGQVPSPAQRTQSGAPVLSQPTQPQRPTHQAQGSLSQLSPPPGGRGGGPPSKVDYRRSAEIVVGAFPSSVACSRPASPNPPSAVLARPPSTQPRDDPVQEFITNYQQSLPGERKIVSRSRAGSVNVQNAGGMQQRPTSSNSMAGVGAQGRSPSPQPPMSQSRAASPNALQRLPPSTQRSVSPAQSQQMARNQLQNSQNRRDSYRGPPLNMAVATPISQVNGMQRPGHQGGQNSISVPSQPGQRAASPNPMGIALDPSGRVARDELADQFNNSRYQPSPVTSQQNPYGPPAQNQLPQRNPSYPPPNQQPQYPQPPAPGPGSLPMYNSQSYPQQPPPQQPQQPIPTQQPYAQQPYQPYPQEYPSVNGHGVQRTTSYNTQGYYQQPPQPPPQQAPPQTVQHFAPPGQMMHPARGPTPQPEQPGQQMASPTGAYTDDGRPILFYVTALYDYIASIPEEFDFQTGDVIAVTATPEDGWWSGELLDEARRQPGRHVFPSNFVQLF